MSKKVSTMLIFMAYMIFFMGVGLFGVYLVSGSVVGIHPLMYIVIAVISFVIAAYGSADD